MTAHKSIYIYDLINRYPSHTFTETTVGSMTNVVFKDSSSVEVASAKNLLAIDAYRAIRKVMLDRENLPYMLTTVERDALPSIDMTCQIYNKTTGQLETYSGSAWDGSSSETPAAFGEMVEDSSTGSTINTTSKLWDSASVGEVDANSLVTFSGSTTGDKLVVGTGGAGTYQVHFSCTFTNEGGNEVSAGIHKNGAEVTKLEDTHEGDSSKKNDLRGQGFLVLAVGDEITLHVVSSTAGDVVKVYHAHVTMVRLTT